MKILIAGSNGLVGSAAAQHLTKCGHEIVRLVRHTPGDGEVWWDPDGGKIEANRLEGFDGVVHLATMPWPARWTTEAKQKIRTNRLSTNRLLAETLAGLSHKPCVFICASGMGYYPSSGDAILTEESPAGSSFLATLQRDGEAATAPASAAGIRVVHLRIPPVLSGAALQRGGMVAGDGRQWTSWIGRDELIHIIVFILTNPGIAGPVNTVNPYPLRNVDFAREMSQTLGKKSVMRLPGFLVRLLMGEMGDEFFLSSRRIQPAKLLAAGYTFHFPSLEITLKHEMEKR